MRWQLIVCLASALVSPATLRRRTRLNVEVSLEKPLGVVLEEGDAGVYIKEILDSGSASSNDDVSEGLRIVAVNGARFEGFDNVMSALGEAPSPVTLTLESQFTLLKVVDGTQTSFVTATKGANLRKTLLASGAKLYDFKGTLTNCNGGGQCGTCRVRVEDHDLPARTDWENDKIKDPDTNLRLACLTLVDGESATIKLRPSS